MRRHRTIRSRLLHRGHSTSTPAPRPVCEDLRLRDLHEQREREQAERREQADP